MTQKELGNFKSNFNTPLMAGEKLEVDSENLVAFKNKNKKISQHLPHISFLNHSSKELPISFV